ALRVENHVVEVALERLANVSASRVIDVGSGAGSAVRLVTRDLWRFALRGVGVNGIDKPLDEPPVVGGEEEGLEGRRRLHGDPLLQVSADNRGELGKENMSWELTAALRNEVTCQCAGELEDEFLQSPLGPELSERNLVNLPWTSQREAPLVVNVQA